MTDAERKDAAKHVLKIMGNGSPAARMLAEEIITEPEWTQEPPTAGGTYWNWNGDVDHAPVPLFVSGPGAVGKAFVRMGQLGISQAVNCDEWGGWWKPLPDPNLPDQHEELARLHAQMCGGRRCPKCHCPMAHYRLSGWRCMKCDGEAAK